MKAESSGTTGQGKPTTADVQESLVNAANFKDFLLRNAQNMLAQTLPEYLSLQLKQKHLRRADVVRGSHLDRTYVYQIFSGKKTPSRDKLLAIAFGLHLSDEETQKMLKLSGNLKLNVYCESFDHKPPPQHKDSTQGHLSLGASQFCVLCLFCSSISHISRTPCLFSLK